MYSSLQAYEKCSSPQPKISAKRYGFQRKLTGVGEKKGPQTLVYGVVMTPPCLYTHLSLTLQGALTLGLKRTAHARSIRREVVVYNLYQITWQNFGVICGRFTFV
jgi:hypothetical protein